MSPATLFSLVGAIPRTDWLPDEIERDAKGFVRTGPDLATSAPWGSKRLPFLVETGPIKRVASALGEGAMTVQFVHECLRETYHRERHEVGPPEKREARPFERASWPGDRAPRAAPTPVLSRRSLPGHLRRMGRHRVDPLPRPRSFGVCGENRGV
ncbi:MAG TPA: hypothetical protein VGH33_16590 [Isosphaeraceae bacterium]